MIHGSGLGIGVLFNRSWKKIQSSCTPWNIEASRVFFKFALPHLLFKADWREETRREQASRGQKLMFPWALKALSMLGWQPGKRERERERERDIYKQQRSLQAGSITMNVWLWLKKKECYCFRDGFKAALLAPQESPNLKSLPFFFFLSVEIIEKS